MLEELIGAYGGRVIVAILGVGVGFLLLIGILWMIRGRGASSPFVRGGKNRQPRLQVLDAAAVDTRRRLVLVRRDDVEHLIMIGGPTDIVVESRIMPTQSRDTVQSRDQFVSPEAFARQEPVASRSQAVETPVRPQPAAPVRQPVPPRVASGTPEAKADAINQASAAPMARPQPAPTPAPALQPAPVPRPAPVATPPVNAVPPRVEPQLRAATPDVRPEPPKPQPAPAPVIAEPAPVAAAVKRDVEPTLIVPASAPAMPEPLQVAAERPKQLGTDFDKLLQQEMEANLAAQDAPQVQAPGTEPKAASTTEKSKPASLEDEVEAVFGEMSATRDR